MKWSKEEVCEKLVARTFTENGLGGMIQVAYGYSTYIALDSAYPGEYKKEDLKGYSKLK